MKVEIGQKVREVFDRSDMTLTDFADKLGTVRQNVYRIFKKTHVDTGLLVKISHVLNHNFFQYYMPQARAEQHEYEQQLLLARKEIDYLRKIIRLMEEKAELVKRLEQEDALR